MPRKATTMSLCLAEEARSRLSALARSRTAPAHHVKRSAIILQLADRHDATEIAVTLGIDRQRLTRCARRVTAVGPLKAIENLPRSGRPPEITEATRIWLIGEACVKPKDRGYPLELSTLRLLAAHARGRGPVAGHACLAESAPSTVREILHRQPIKPHKVRYYIERRDPNFDERKAEVLDIYAAAHLLRNLPEAERPVWCPTMRSRAFRRLPPRHRICRPCWVSTPPCSMITNTSGWARSRFQRLPISSPAMSIMP
jgi:hypothetical protein